jgi:Protein of unknown function
MNRETAEKLIGIYSRIRDRLNEATEALRTVGDDEERKQALRVIAGVMASLRVDLEMPILRVYPRLAADDEVPVPDPPLTPQQQARVDRLSAAQLAAIDDALLKDACDRWRKVARIVGSACGALEAQIPGVPDLFYAHRVRHLVASGRLESQGNLAVMRFSEVRLPRSQE